MAANETSSQTKVKLTFDGLSTDIKALIIDKILRPSDLLSVCLVNKQLHEIAVKPLYKEVSLHLGQPTDTCLSAFLNPQNIGLKYIRTMKIYVPRRSSKEMQQAQLMCRMILEFLPEDILEKFSWCPWYDYSAENVLLLYRKQRKLKWLEVVRLDKDILSALSQNTKVTSNVFLHARKLALYPDNRMSLDHCGFYLTHMKDVVEDLIIHSNFHRDVILDSEDVEDRELHDSATAPGLLTRTIFNSLDPFDQCNPLPNLKAIQLRDVNVRFCADTWCKIIDFNKIEDLQLIHCTGADTLLGHLSKATNLPRKLKVLVLRHRDNQQNEALLALDGFLCLVSGIKELCIDLSNVDVLPAAAGITRHGKTLEHLNVHCSATDHDEPPTNDDELVWDADDFEKICKGCPLIEQLSCAWPRAFLTETTNNDYSSFLRSCSWLRNMVTLHISTFPKVKPTTLLLPLVIYEQLLQNLAARAFSQIAPRHRNYDPRTGEKLSDDVVDTRNGKLRIVAFGSNENVCEQEDSKNQIIYLRSTCMNAMGITHDYATPITWLWKKFIEPRSWILDADLMNTDARPPCKENATPGLNWGDDDDDD